MSNDQGNSPIVKPEVLHLFDILQEVMLGRIRVPRFQRPFVWRRAQMVDLLDSIWRQFPIGSLLVWEPDPNQDYQYMDQIGPHRVAEPKTGTWAMLLDGHQRVSTLVGTLWQESPSEEGLRDDEDPGRWDVYFNAEGSGQDGGYFQHLRPTETREPYHVPVRMLMDTLDILKASQRLISSMDERADTWIRRTQGVARSLAAYKLPVIRIQQTELDDAVEIFARLNKKGRSMSADQMFSALTYREGEDSFHLAAEIDSIMDRLRGRGFGDVKRDSVLRTAIAILDEDMYRTDWTRLGRDKRKRLQPQLPQAMEDTSNALENALSFLEGLGVHNDRMLPYEMQLVALAVFFSQKASPTPEQRRLLTRWFWATSFTSWFGGTNPSRVRQMVSDMRDRVATEQAPTSVLHLDFDTPAISFPSAFDMRAARTRALMCVMAAHEPKGPDGRIIDTSTMLRIHGFQALGRVVATANDSNLKGSPGNRMFSPAPERRGQERNWLADLDPSNEEHVHILASHAITPQAQRCLVERDHDEFLTLRQDQLIRWEREFMMQQEVAFPTTRATAVAPLDADGPGFSEDTQ